MLSFFWGRFLLPYKFESVEYISSCTLLVTFGWWYFMIVSWCCCWLWWWLWNPSLLTGIPQFQLDWLQSEHSSAFTYRREEARPHQARAAGLPSLASRPTARPVQVVSADVQGAPWSGTAVYRWSLPTSHISWQQTETSICHSRRPRGHLLRHTLWLPCVRCGGPKGMEPAASAFTGTRDSWPFQDSIKDLSSLHPVTVPNCLTRRTLVMTLSIHVTAR